MPLLPLFGHQALRDRLNTQVARGALPASLLLQGPPGVGKQQLALWLGRRLLCTEANAPCGECQHCKYALAGVHPDLRWYFPLPHLKPPDPPVEVVTETYDAAVAERLEEGGVYASPDGSAGIYRYVSRCIVQQATRTPAMARRKIFVVGNADRMVPQASSPDAANAFLKLLEEPPEDTTIILTTSEPGALLPTIRSRVVTVRVPRLGADDMRAFVEHPSVRDTVAKSSKNLDALLALANGAPGMLIGADDRSAAVTRAKALLDASRQGSEVRLRAAFTQGSSKARGAFSDVLDALTVLLRDASQRAAVAGDAAGAVAAARAVSVVEESKRAAEGNAIPQLVTAQLLEQLAGLGA